MNEKNMQLAGVMCVMLLVAGCSSMLPKADQKTVSPWHDFEEVKAAYDLVTPGQSDRERVHGLGFDPTTRPNVQILNYSEIANATLPRESLVAGVELPAGIRACIQAQDRCVGYSLEETRIKRDRTGNFWTDFLNFRRETSIKGWRFKALFVLVDGTVVFKQWSGQPNIQEISVSRNPLGPFQGAGEKMSTFQ